MDEYERKPSSEYDPFERGEEGDDAPGHPPPAPSPPPPPSSPPGQAAPPVAAPGEWAAQPGHGPQGASVPPVIGHGSGLPPGRGGAILGLGIAGLCISAFSCGCCQPVGLVGIILSTIAVVMGVGDRRALREGRIDPSSQGMVTTGWILGIIGIVLGALALVFFILSLALNLAAPGGGGPWGGF